MTMHPGQLAISVPTVRALVDSQFPGWRELPVRQVVTEGTVNAIFRIGDELAARFPLSPQDPARARSGLTKEAAAAREISGRSRFPVPEPIALGEPGHGYPQPWSVQTWLNGVTATDEDPGESNGFAADLAEFIAAVRSIDTGGRTFIGEGRRGRGGDLKDHDQWLETCFRESEQFLDVPKLRRLWAQLRELPREAPDVMNHGDLTPGNVLVDAGRLAGVLDVGDLGPADPALDLISAWNLLEAGPRQLLRTALGCGDLDWERGRAWAFQQAMGLVWYYVESNPSMSRMGLRTLDRILQA
jgi:aminoglycoside phosphotransferase (APT) family kinase protein